MIYKFSSLKISELVERLLKIKKTHGDLSIVSYAFNTEDACHGFISSGNIEVVLLNKKGSDFLSIENSSGKEFLEISFF